MSRIAVVILAAGKGTRMKSRLSKVLHSLAGLPMLHHVVATARVLKPSKIALVLGPGMETVAAALPAGEPTIETVAQEPRLGTGHAVQCARAALKGFKGDVGVVPRQFLREFVTQMDLVDEHPDYDPMVERGFAPADMSPEEEHALGDGSPQARDEDDELVPQEDAW